MSNGSGHPISTDFVGRKHGRYSAAVISHGFVGSVTDVPTAPGVHDELRGQGDNLTFGGGESRPLTVALAQQPTTAGATAWSATLHTEASSKRSDSAGLTPTGALSYRHEGAPASVSFTLSSLGASSGSTRFASGPVKIGDGDQLSVKPDAGLGAVRVTVRDRHGHTRAMILHDHAKAPAALILGRLRLAGSRVTVLAAVAGLRSRAVIGAVLRIVRGHRTLLRRVTSAMHARNGRVTLSFSIPHLARGHYRLLANAGLITIAKTATSAVGSVQADTHTTVRIR